MLLFAQVGIEEGAAVAGDLLLTVAEVAEKLRVKPDTVRIWLREKRLNGIHLGDRAGWRIEREELDRFIAAQQDQPPTSGEE